MNPGLVAGTAAVASPILIHILSKRRYRRVSWAAMDFLLEAHRQNRRRVRMEQLILLALRCIAVLLIALILARPFLRAGSVVTMLGPGGRSERIILLDDSYSMGYRLPDGQSVFHRAVAAVKQVAESIASRSANDSLTLLLTSHPRQTACALPSLSAENARKLDDALEPLQASQVTARFADACRAVAQLIQSAPTQANIVVYVVSDFQRVDWSKAAGEPWCASIAPLASLAKSNKSCRITLIDVSADAPRNIAITDLNSTQPQMAAGVPVRFEAAVTNYSAVVVEQLELSCAIADQTLPSIVIPRIQPGQTLREPIEVTFPQEGADQLRVQLAGAAATADPVALDNVRWLGAQVASSIHVLIVNGEPGSDPLRDEVYLLRTALRPAGRAASGFELTTVTEQELDGIDWGRFHVAILANVARLTTGARQSLESFVRGGGGLIIFGGDQVDAEYYNRELYADGRGLLAVQIAGTVAAPAGREPFHISEWDSNHAVLRSFGGPLAAVLRQVRVNEFLSVSASGSATASQPTTAPAGPQILAHYDDPEQLPAIVAGSFGRGKVFFVSTSADQEWNDWASNFSFVPLVLEMTGYAARTLDSPAQVTAGTPLVVPLDSTMYKPSGRLRSPSYPVDPEFPIEAVKGDDSRASIRHADTDRCGVWSLELNTVSGESSRMMIAVNPDPAESDVAPAGRAGLEAAMGELKFDYVRDLSAFSGDPDAGRQEIWWPLLLVAVAVLMVEHSLAWRFGRG